MADERSIEKTVRIRATPDAVWKALTEAEEITRWFAPEARATPGAGGRVWLSWGPGMEGEAKVDLWDPPRHLRHAFGPNRSGGAPLFVDYFVEGEGGETVVRLVHSGFGVGTDWDDELDSHDRGWGIFLRNLRHYLERHAGTPCVQSVFAQPTQLGRAEAWKRLLAGIDPAGALAGAQGGAYRLVTAAGTELRGAIEVYSPGRDLALTIANLDDALLRVGFEGPRDKTFLFGTILAYGADASALHGELQRLLGSLEA